MTIAVPILRAAIISGGTPSWVQSHAASMLGAEAQGLALDFTDQFWLAATGHYGSAKVIDTGTPANNFDSIPDALLTYTGTTKLCRQSDGVYRYGPHNLYVNSAAPANQSITVVSGASYAVTITGSVSVTASGAATGTWTAGTNTFTAATATLTLGSTSGSGTVHVRRTPSDSTYIATGASAKYGLPYEWDASGVLQGILVEPQATNLVVQSANLSVSPWAKFTGGVAVTAVTTANAGVAPDGTATASRLRFDCGDAGSSVNRSIVYQPVTISNATAYAGSVYIKAYDAGNVGKTVRFYSDVGFGSTIITLTDSWQRVSTTGTSSSTSSNIGLETRGSYTTQTADCLVWCPQFELGSVATSPIITYAASATRAADSKTKATSALPWSATLGTVFVQAKTASGSGTQVLWQADDGSENNRFRIVRDSSNNLRFIVTTASSEVCNINLGTVANSTSFKVVVAWAENDFAATLNGGTVGTDASGALPTVTTVREGSSFTGEQWNSIIANNEYLPRRMSNADMQALTT